MAHAATAPSRPRAADRLRPGERPGWWDASGDRSQFGTWRDIAADHQVGVDTAIAVLIELQLVYSDLRACVDEPLVMLSAALAHESASLPRVGGPGPWRRWLAPGLAPYEHDELPELVLPERLIARLTPGARLSDHLHLDRLTLALDCDRHAARHGRTLESWALVAALSPAATQRRLRPYG